MGNRLIGYFFLKKNVIENIAFSSIGYKILLEILTKGSYENVKEVPYTFKSRQNGNSKLGKDEYINYLRLLYRLLPIPSRLKGTAVVEVVSIDDLIAQKILTPPKLVKIDVEGSELDTLHGMEQTIRTFKL